MIITFNEVFELIFLCEFSIKITLIPFYALFNFVLEFVLKETEFQSNLNSYSNWFSITWRKFKTHFRKIRLFLTRNIDDRSLRLISII